MLPFMPPFPPAPNQTQTHPTNDPSQQQLMLPGAHFAISNHLYNGNLSHQFPSQIHGFNHQHAVPAMNTFNNHITQFTNVHNRPPVTPYPCFPNVATGNHIAFQNGQVSMSPQNLNMVQVPVQGQMCNAMQNNPNVRPQSSGQFLFPGGQVIGFPNGQFGMQNPIQNLSQVLPTTHCQVPPFNNQQSSHPSMTCPNQTPYLPGSHSPLMTISQCGVGNSSVNSNSKVLTNEAMQFNNQAQMHQPVKNIQSNGFHQSQVSTVGGERNMSNANQGGITAENFMGYRKDKNVRFQRPQLHNTAIAKGNFRPAYGNWGKGNHNKAAGKPQLERSSKKSMGECNRFPPPNYTAEEIQQWREARRRNFPSKSNMDEKLGEKNTNNGLDDDAKLRRQQLREILAKQAEMGIEVAELPPQYLLESEYQSSQKKDLDSQGDVMEDGRRRYNKRGRFRNKFDKRGNKHGRKNRWGPKKQRSGGDGSSAMAISNRKQPTLLQKLLSADIKRDKLRLLQAIRFMMLNSFFEGWPEKPLKFPLVIVKDEGTNDNIVIKKSQYEGSGSVCAVDNSVSKGVEDQNYNQNTVGYDDNHEDEDADDSDEELTYEHGENGASCKPGEESKSEGEITD